MFYCPYFIVKQNYKKNYENMKKIQLANCFHDKVLLVSAVTLRLQSDQGCKCIVL